MIAWLEVHIKEMEEQIETLEQTLFEFPGQIAGVDTSLLTCGSCARRAGPEGETVEELQDGTRLFLKLFRRCRRVMGGRSRGAGVSLELVTGESASSRATRGCGSAEGEAVV
ncbi:hypothetical protein FA13DRAFT_1455699 [Coprinellus micaceus]|uniref:Uncharacterized protein n=1 Tax=Coprinellus micaceus TaxID=71717 RepID=A0A4Y7SMQ2_COPMI|nr:hypothetical protein FA13DRAFT_1455699 [Coprinellus micaceus]